MGVTTLAAVSIKPALLVETTLLVSKSCTTVHGASRFIRRRDATMLYLQAMFPILRQLVGQG